MTETEATKKKDAAFRLNMDVFALSLILHFGSGWIGRAGGAGELEIFWARMVSFIPAFATTVNYLARVPRSMWGLRRTGKK